MAPLPAYALFMPLTFLPPSVPSFSLEFHAKTKTTVDEQQLRLQSLLYEKMHLLQEIRKCEQFHSRHEDIDMVPPEELFAAEPEDAKQLQSDPHKLMLARLDFELKQRQEFVDSFFFFFV